MIQSSKPNSSFQKFFFLCLKMIGSISFLEAKWIPNEAHQLGSLGHRFTCWYLNIPSQVRSVGTAICALMVRSRSSRGKKGVWVVELVELFFCFFSKLQPSFRGMPKKKGSYKMSGGRYQKQSISMLIFCHFFLSDHFWSFPLWGFFGARLNPAGSKTTISWSGKLFGCPVGKLGIL